VPEIPYDLVATELPGRLLGLWPEFFSYVASFFVIGFYWMAHYRIFHFVSVAAAKLSWLLIAMVRPILLRHIRRYRSA
jgi:uncharacterized membrane protein